MSAAAVVDNVVRSRSLPAKAVDDLTRAWLALDAEPWRTLLVVAPGGVADAEAIAAGLAEIARRVGNDQLVLVDGRDVAAERLAERLSEIDLAVREGRRSLVLVEGPSRAPTAKAFARRCDAAVLCVALGETSRGDAEAAIEVCGRDRFLGAIVLRAG